MKGKPTIDSLLSRAEGVYNYYNTREILKQGELDALLLAIETLAYLKGKPYVNFLPEDVKGEDGN